MMLDSPSLQRDENNEGLEKKTKKNAELYPFREEMYDYNAFFKI
jgi:hypothetical protein